jgi:hypothetical protein
VEFMVVYLGSPISLLFVAEHLSPIHGAFSVRSLYIGVNLNGQSSFVKVYVMLIFRKVWYSSEVTGTWKERV